MHARLRGSNSLFTLYQIINKRPDFPSIADEIAKPHLDMNIKVAAFTVSEKSSNTDSKEYIPFLRMILQWKNSQPIGYQGLWQLNRSTLGGLCRVRANSNLFKGRSC